MGGHDRVVGRVPPPDDAQLLDRVAVDLIERRVFGAAGVAAIRRPSPLGRPTLSPSGGRATQDERQEDKRDAVSHGASSRRRCFRLDFRILVSPGARVPNAAPHAGPYHILRSGCSTAVMIEPRLEAVGGPSACAAPYRAGRERSEATRRGCAPGATAGRRPSSASSSSSSSSRVRRLRLRRAES